MTQMAFLTLFLGLTLGPQPVELTVTGPVAAVELLLDGAPVARLDGPPWKGEIDFGPALLPHELVARALDGQGRETGRVSQWVNLPRPPAEVDLVVVESDARGRPAVVRFSWQSLTGEAPSEVSVTLDGKPLRPDADNRVRLPATDPSTVHVLSVELRFFSALVARRDMAFGGDLGDEVATELTAVVVRVRKGQKLPPLAELDGWFLAKGRPLAAVAIEEAPAQLLIVRASGAREALLPFAAGAMSRVDRLAEPPPSALEARRYELLLDPEDKIGFVWPRALTSLQSGAPAELFDASRLYDARDGGLLWYLTRVIQEGGTGAERPADAVAVAGLLTLYKNYRRAVLLVLGDREVDASRAGPALVRGYLEAIRVPLRVWTAGDAKAPATRAWGEVEAIGSLGRLRGAFARLEKDLASQRIIWVAGRHLPQSITLSPAAARVLELAH